MGNSVRAPSRVSAESYFMFGAGFSSAVALVLGVTGHPWLFLLNVGVCAFNIRESYRRRRAA